MIKSKRCGKFAVSIEFLNNKQEYAKKHIFSNMIIFESEICLFYQMVSYTAVSEKFREVKVGEEIPWYKIFIQDENVNFVEFASCKEIREIPTDYGNSVIEIPYGYKLIKEK
jgi:hypothetical protein